MVSLLSWERRGIASFFGAIGIGRHLSSVVV